MLMISQILKVENFRTFFILFENIAGQELRCLRMVIGYIPFGHAGSQSLDGNPKPNFRLAIASAADFSVIGEG